MKKLLLAAVLLLPAATRAVTIREYSLPQSVIPSEIVVGPDGNMWFTDDGPGTSLGRVTPDGTVDWLPTGCHPISLSLGPDGTLWFNCVGLSRIDVSGNVTSYPLLPKFYSNIASGPLGFMWYLSADLGAVNNVIAVTPAGTVWNQFKVGSANIPSGLAAGGDGRVWITIDNDQTIYRLDPLQGTSTPMSVAPHFPLDIVWCQATGGVAWNDDSAPFVRVHTAAGDIDHSYPGASIGAITCDSEAVWFNADSFIGRIDLSTGASTTFPIPGGGRGIAVGPDGSIWYTELNGRHKIGRLFIRSIPGDVNGDGTVDVADVFYLINFLFAGGPAPVP